MPPPQAHPLVFLHIPKTSGIAVADAMLQATRAPRTMFGFDRAFFGGFADFASVPEPNRGFIHLTPETVPRGEAFVRAHMSAATLRAAYPRGRFVTVLREPASRLLSHYVFWRGFPEPDLAAWGGFAERMREAHRPWADFLGSPAVACQTDNVALRLLLWPDPRIPADGFISPRFDRALLRAARRVLRGFDHVGVSEAPDFWPRLRAWLGGDFAPARRNETAALPPARAFDMAAGFTAPAFAALDERTRLDRELWRWALARAGDGDAEAIAREAQWRTLARLAPLAAGRLPG